MLVIAVSKVFYYGAGLLAVILLVTAVLVLKRGQKRE